MTLAFGCSGAAVKALANAPGHLLRRNGFSAMRRSARVAGFGAAFRSSLPYWPGGGNSSERF
jgi:hypothetical protein